MAYNRHLIVFIAFAQAEIIKTSFDSIYDESFDYFVVENISENSPIIQKYFSYRASSASNIKGYIQFRENISATAMDCFLLDFDNLIRQYDYLTITDGDFFMYDIKDAMAELVLAFQDPKCLVSSVPLYLDNNYDRGKDRIIGTNVFCEKQKERQFIEHFLYPGITSACFLTFKTNNFDFLKCIHFIDTNIHKKVMSLGGQWLVCEKNQAYHLTWDLYFDGNPYYEWKKAVIHHIWEKVPYVSYNRFF